MSEQLRSGCDLYKTAGQNMWVCIRLWNVLCNYWSTFFEGCPKKKSQCVEIQSHNHFVTAHTRSLLIVVQNKINPVFFVPPASHGIYRSRNIVTNSIWIYALWPFVSFPAAGEKHCEAFSSNGHNQPQLPFGCDPVADILHGQLTHSDSSDNNSTAGSQVEHQKSVKAEQLYDHAFFTTMLLYHGS